MKTPVSYATPELAERMGRQEAEKMTKRGYPTTFVRVERVVVNGMALDGQSPSEMGYVKMESNRFIAVLEEL